MTALQSDVNVSLNVVQILIDSIIHIKSIEAYIFSDSFLERSKGQLLRSATSITSSPLTSNIHTLVIGNTDFSSFHGRSTLQRRFAPRDYVSCLPDLQQHLFTTYLSILVKTTRM